MGQIISSLQNPKIKHVVKLRERRHRDAEGVMLIEGRDELALALAGSGRVYTVFICSQLFSKGDNARVLGQAQQVGAELIEVSPAVFEKIAYRENPDGWLALAPAPRRRLSDLALPENPLLLIVEAVEKPGNLGAMLRTADAAGADALILCDPATDLGNPNVVRASRGALFTVPVAQAESTEALSWLEALKIQIVATTPGATRSYTQVDLRGPVAIAVGTEDQGLSAAWLKQADLAVRIPMVGRVNSLNVAASAAVLLYEAVRQRDMKRET
jgi:TrmH family RNA methyltransferase